LVKTKVMPSQTCVLRITLAHPVPEFFPKKIPIALFSLWNSFVQQQEASPHQVLSIDLMKLSLYPNKHFLTPRPPNKKTPSRVISNVA
jgi:hypothetical protein